VSSELDRLLRDARQALPVPDEQSTGQARRASLGTLGGGRRRSRVLMLVGATIVAALALGLTAGSLNAPTGRKAKGPVDGRAAQLPEVSDEGE